MAQTNARGLRWPWIAGGSVAIIAVALAVCEALGWPFLAAPTERWVGHALQRPVSFSDGSGAAAPVRIHLLGRIEVTSGYLRIGAPAWSKEPFMLQARDARLRSGYADLWRASRGEPLHIRELRAAELDGRIERLADGRASWQFGKATDAPDTSEQPTRVPTFGLLQVDAGGVVVHDALMAVDLVGSFSLAEGASAKGLQFAANGSYRQLPVKVTLKTVGVLPVLADDAGSTPLPVTLDAVVGGARLTFNGTATDALKLTALKGRFTVQGPSLAAVGDPLGVTLPTTGPFRVQGGLAKQGVVWNVVADQLAIGASRVAGAFTFDPRPVRPLLSGRLSGSKLLLADLGPAVGTAPPRADTAAVKPASAKPGRVLPDRPFDLPSLRAMDANVLVDIANLDLGSDILEPLRPLRTHLVLQDGVLTLRDIDARTGQGTLGGTVQLDGRAAQALWTANLRWDGVRLESWIHQARANGAPPYVTGNLNGQARVAGQGKSTAAILGSLHGGVRMQLLNGSISHLAIEAAGLDLAQGLGVLVKGDDALPVQCTVADLTADQGVLRPRALVLDTRDSTLWVDGSLSLASEAMDLRVVVTPKDFSPLALRTPLHLRGSFANPSVSLEKGKLGTKLGAAALLSLINPVAALIPLIDVGDSDEARRGAAGCQALARRIAAQPQLPAPRK